MKGNPSSRGKLRFQTCTLPHTGVERRANNPASGGSIYATENILLQKQQLEKKRTLFRTVEGMAFLLT